MKLRMSYLFVVPVLIWSCSPGEKKNDAEATQAETTAATSPQIRNHPPEDGHIHPDTKFEIDSKGNPDERPKTGLLIRFPGGFHSAKAKIIPFINTRNERIRPSDKFDDKNPNDHKGHFEFEVVSLPVYDSLTKKTVIIEVAINLERVIVDKPKHDH